MRWTKAFRKAAGKEMSVDSTFDMEKRRNRVQKYDRQAMATTLRVMKKVQKVREAREERFYERRMKVKKQQEKTQNKVEIKQNISLVAPAPARAKELLNEMSEKIAARKERKMDYKLRMKERGDRERRR